MEKVIFQRQVITKTWMGTGRWELRFSQAVNFRLFCPLWNQMAEHPDGFITDRQTRSEADRCAVGFALPKYGCLARSSKACGVCSPFSELAD